MNKNTELEAAMAEINSIHDKQIALFDTFVDDVMSSYWQAVKDIK